MSRAAAGVHLSTSQLGRIDVRGPVDWGARASEFGWYDQAHLIRDVHRHTGVTPTAYLEAQRTYPSSDEDATAGFVPDINTRRRDTSKT